MDTLIQDLRFSLRSLRRSPGLVVAVTATLALAVGATAAVYTVVRDVLLEPLDLPESERLVALCETHPSTASFCVASPPNALDWAERSRNLSGVGVGRDWPFLWRSPTGSESVHGIIATPELMTVLGLRAEQGRLFEPTDQPGTGRPVIVLGKTFWREHFGADPGIVGREIVLDDQPHTIVGVLDRELPLSPFRGGQIWRPLHIDPADEQYREWRGFLAVGRRAPHASLAEVRSELDTVRSLLADRHPRVNRDWGLEVQPLLDRVVGPVRPMLWTLAAAVSLLLLVGCTNIANLLLARATARRTELATRCGLGASRPRLLRQLLTESLLLALPGGLIGAVVAWGATRLFLAFAPGRIPRLTEVRPDPGVVLFAIAVTLATASVFGVAPAWRVLRDDLARHLAGGPRGSAMREGGRRGLAIAQLALALVLVSTALLLGRGLVELLRWSPAVPPDRLVTVSLFSSGERFSSGDQVLELHRRAREEIAALPGVAAVGMASAGSLFGGVETGELTVEGRSRSEGETPASTRWYDVDERYFEAVGRRLVAGRLFDARDHRDAPPVAIVNETLARRHWEGGWPIGERVTIEGRSREIVGVVEDPDPFPPGTSPEAELFWPNRQEPRWANFLVIRVAIDPEVVVPAIRSTLERLDPELQSGFATLRERLELQASAPRFQLTLVLAFALLALALAAIGTFSVLACLVVQRRREVGIRLALGARRGSVVGMVVGEGLRLLLLGSALGLAGTVVTSRLLGHFVPEGSGLDPLIVGGAMSVLAVAVLLACLAPAWRASGVDPVRVLREE